MPWDDPDPTDPSLLVGMEVPGDESSVVEMAWAFAEEYAALGLGEEQILRMFRKTSYAAPRDAYERLGAAAIIEIVRECVSVWGRVRFVVEDAVPAEQLVSIRLPVRRGEEG